MGQFDLNGDAGVARSEEQAQRPQNNGLLALTIAAETQFQSPLIASVSLDFDASIDSMHLAPDIPMDACTHTS